jgi:HEAT repeat protein
MIEASDLQKRYREDPRSSEELIAIASTKGVEIDGDDYQELIAILQARLPSIFHRIKELVASDDPNSRNLAATVLGQNYKKDKEFDKECIALLKSMLAHEKSTTVQESIIYALGHHHSLECLPTLLQFERHPKADVRYALSFALGGLEEDSALEALCRLSSDGDRDTRSWATFGIGTLSSKNSELIKQALAARLDDEDDEVRGEALVGLAERCEICVVPAFLRELQNGHEEMLRKWELIKDEAAAVRMF